MMGLTLVMSMRLHILEKIFGGLDKNYKFHAFVGSFAFITLILHPVFLAINRPSNAWFYFFPGQRLAANLGISAMYLVLFAFTFIKVIKIPYQTWLNTHSLLAVAFLLGSLHAYLAPSNLVRSPLLAGWIGLWVFTGLVGAIYSIIVYRLFGIRFHYTVSKLTKAGGILTMLLKPNNQKITFIPGQFMYIRFRTKHLGAEMHPFSATSSPSENELRISIKPLGDYTKKLYEGAIKVGDKAEVYGPYGAFGEEYQSGKGPMVWVAGGIGVAPFLSLLHAEYQNQTHRPVLFYYAVNKASEAAYDNEIKKIVSYLPHIHYVSWIADDKGLLDAETIIHDYMSIFSPQAHATQMPKFLLCGPPVMLHSLSHQLRAHQIRPDYIIYEEFNFIH